MRKKLMGTYIIVILFTMAFTILFSWNATKQYFLGRLEDQNAEKAVLLKEILEKELDEGAVDLQQFVDQYATMIASRITVIDRAGVVVADSEGDVSLMGNHKNRQEILEAFETDEIAASLRFSNTLKVYYQYIAIPVHQEQIDGVLRIAAPLEEVNHIIKVFLAMLAFGILAGGILSGGLAYILSSKLMIPIVDLKDAAVRVTSGRSWDKIYIDQDDEIGELADAFNSMTFQLKQNLDDLTSKNAELESILASLTNGLMVVDMDFRVRVSNKSFEELFKLENRPEQGRLFYEVVRNLAVFELLEHALEKNERCIKESRFYDGKVEKTYLIYANPIRSQAHPELQMGALLIVQDISQMRKLENMRSDFVSNVTHELKTPLTSIRGFIDTLKGGALSEPEVATRFLDIIDIEAERLEGLINDILILSEIEAMGGDKNVQPNAVKDIIDEVNSLLGPEAQNKDIELVQEISHDMRPYPCNRNRIKQLLINLVSNAIKYTDRGRISVGCREEMGYLVMEIEDTGIGIEAVHIPRLFERFYRVDKGRSRATGGTGLGLSIVKHIVELYNGRIKVESQVGKGTKFTVRLPY